MLSRIDNQYGKITIDSTLLQQIISNAFEPWSGRVWIANYKGSQSDAAVMLGSFSSLAEVRTEKNAAGIKITIYVMVKFGESISAICSNITQNIADDAKALLGLDVDDVEIIVTAVLAKRASPREIIYSYRHRDVGPVNMIEAAQAFDGLPGESYDLKQNV
jgi:uncharacterized alkaline shock family protein YloU